MRRLLWCLVLLPIFLVGSCSKQPTASQELPPRASRAASVSPAAPIEKKTQSATVQPKPLTPDAIHILGVTAKVVSSQMVGNELMPPPNPRVLGWWGQKAGAKHGTTLLVGHTVHTGGGVLDNLEDVSVGSDLVIYGWRDNLKSTKAYTTAKYKVVSNQIISKNALAARAQHLFSQTGPHKLVVVTCEGYNWSTGIYADNVVTIAKQVHN